MGPAACLIPEDAFGLVASRLNVGRGNELKSEGNRESLKHRGGGGCNSKISGRGSVNTYSKNDPVRKVKGARE